MRSWERVKLAAAVGATAAILVCAGARAEEGDKPAEAGAKAPEAVDGLQLTLLIKERTFRAGGGANATDRTVKVLTLQIKNVGEKPLVLDFPLPGAGGVGGGRFGGGGPAGVETSPVKLFAKDANGKEVPPPEARTPNADAPKPEDKPATLTVLKPGQVLEQPLMGAIRFPADGKYTVRAELDVTAKGEVLPGLKVWTGKVKSAEIEYDYKGFGGGGNRGNRPGGGGTNPPPPPPPPAGEKENF